MPKYNLYKLHLDKKEAVIEKLESVHLNGQKTVVHGDYSLQLFFPERPEERDVPWLKHYEEFIDDEDLKEVKNRVYFAVLLLWSDKWLYAVSMGKSHFYLKEFCDLDFGIDIGIRIIDSKHIQIKNAKLFGGIKRKSLIVYKSNTSIDVDAGESIVYLKGKTKNPGTWGKTLVCGHSALFSVKNMSPIDLPQFVEGIESTLQKEKPAFEIPRAVAVVNSDEKRELDKKLISSFQNSELDVGIEEQSLSGVDFIFQKDFRYQLLANRRSVEIESDITVHGLYEAINSTGIVLNETTINEIKIKSISDESSVVTRNIKSFLDYMNEEYYFLNEGIWYHFNKKYIDYVQETVSQIEIEHFDSYTYNQNDFQNFLASLSKEEAKKWYAEKYFNEEVAGKNGMVCIDRVLAKYKKYHIEISDLYDPATNTLYSVKIGSTQKLSYVFDQADATVKYLVDHQRQFEIDGIPYKPQGIGLWLILDRISKIQSLLDIKSFLFLMSICEWKKTVSSHGYLPKVRISYKNGMGALDISTASVRVGGASLSGNDSKETNRADKPVEIEKRKVE